MALFKVFRGQRNDLDSITKVDGHAYFCTDDGTFWVDHQETDEIVRTQINKADWNKDINNAIENLLNSNQIVVNAEITSTKSPFLISKIDENGSRRATLVIGEKGRKDGKDFYKLGLQAEAVALQTYTVNEDGSKTSGPGISASSLTNQISILGNAKFENAPWIMAEPTDNYHAVNKVYVDKKLAGDQTFKNVTISGDLDVQGTVTTVNQESITVNDNIIVTNAHGAATPYTGTVAITGNKCTVIDSSNSSGAINIKSDAQIDLEKLKGLIAPGEIISINVAGYSSGGIWTDFPVVALVFKNDNNWISMYAETTDNEISTLLLGDECTQITLTQSIIITNEKELAILQEIFNLNELVLREAEEAYATAIYNTVDNEIQLGLGYITRTDEDKVEFTFGGNENQALATRASNIENGHVIKWDSQKKQLVDGGSCLADTTIDSDFFNSLY